LNVPEAVGVPLMVIVFDAQDAVTPAGKPFAPETPEFEIPVAPVVAIVIFDNAVFIHNVGVDDAAPNVLFAVTDTCTAEEVVEEQVLAFVTVTVNNPF
jgi:hypothetical protein